MQCFPSVSVHGNICMASLGADILWNTHRKGRKPGQRILGTLESVSSS